MLPTLLAMDKHEQQQEESQDDGESDDHECTVSAKKIKLEYTVKGAKHAKLFFGELKTQADLNFAQLHGKCATKWIQQRLI